MSIRLSEIHPAVVHFPLALVPIAVGSDTFARVTGMRELRTIGKWSIVGAAISASVAGIFGLIAQEEVTLDEEGEKVLKTHRALNVGLLGALAAMATVRVNRNKPSLAYLIAGASALALMGVSAYLGGKLVYDFGAGVKHTRGIGPTDAEVTPRTSLRAASQAAKDLGRGVKHAAEDVKNGDILPALKKWRWS
ncbi:MAG TPA: DUF2231 domain-containing protein [Labilithrix sp.]|nr:DUF2231 domain-containing protein [Labilithrix sp.]